MNVAVLFDSAESGEAGAGTLLAGKELYSYSLKVFYLHPGIDCIVMMRCGSGAVEGYIEGWKAEYGVNKPVRICQESRSLRQAVGKAVENAEREQAVDLYVLHDIRYPFVNADMVYRVMEKAAIHGLAGTAGEIGDDLVFMSGRKILGKEGLYYMEYPVAVRAGHMLLEKIGEKVEMLELAAGQGMYLCKTGKRNHVLYPGEGTELAEKILQMKGAADPDRDNIGH